MTGTTLKPLCALLLLLGAVTAGCRSETHTAPARVAGAVALDFQWEQRSKDGQPKHSADFPAALTKALQARGVTVDVEGKAAATVKGRASLMDEGSKSSTIGGPMAFFFVNGAYDLAVVDAAGKERGRVQGALDLRERKGDALKAAVASYDQTAATIVNDAAPKVADQLVQMLWDAKLLSAEK